MTPPPLEVREMLTALTEARVDFVVIGGIAVNAHGVIRATKDVDICPASEPDNLTRLASAHPET